MVAEPPADVPDSFEELWERLDSSEGILVTADKRKTLGLRRPCRRWSMCPGRTRTNAPGSGAALTAPW